MRMTWHRNAETWAKMAELRAEGLSTTKIAARLGVAETGVRYAIKKMAAVPIQKRDKDLPDATIARMEELAYRIARRKWQKCL